MMQSRTLRRGLLVWLVALVALLPFLHAHAYGDTGDAAGFLHVHLVADGDGRASVTAADVDSPGEMFVAQDGQRLQIAMPIVASDGRTTPPPPTTTRVAALQARADAFVSAHALLAARPRAPPAI